MSYDFARDVFGSSDPYSMDSSEMRWRVRFDFVNAAAVCDPRTLVTAPFTGEILPPAPAPAPAPEPVAEPRVGGRPKAQTRSHRR